MTLLMCNKNVFSEPPSQQYGVPFGDQNNGYNNHINNHNHNNYDANYNNGNHNHNNYDDHSEVRISKLFEILFPFHFDVCAIIISKSTMRKRKFLQVVT